jgi:hypothetical protein
MVSLDTDCMIAETMGIFSVTGHSSLPFLYFTKGVFNDTFAGIQPSGVYPGTSKYSLNVLDGSE